MADSRHADALHKPLTRAPHAESRLGHMKTTILGRTGMRVSRICLGCMSYGSPEWRPWVLDEHQSRPFFKRAIAALEVELSPDEIRTLEKPYQPHSVRGMGRAALFRPARRDG